MFFLRKKSKEEPLAPRATGRIGAIKRNHRLSTERISKSITGIVDVTDNLIHLTEEISRVADAEKVVVGKVVEEITGYSALMQEVLAATENSMRLSQQTLEIAYKGSEAMEGSARAMQLIEQSVNEAKAITKMLRTKSEDIHHMLTVTKEIAGTTRMLSLNASIEAARYGDEGHGFMAVAEGIRELADRSVEAVAKIKDCITLINSAIDDTDAALEGILQKVSRGEQSAVHITTVFRSIMESVDSANHAFEEISTAVAGQTHRLEDIVSTTHEMSNSFDKLARIVDVSSVYTQVTKSSLTALEAIARDLEDMSRVFHAGVAAPETDKRLVFNLPQEPDTFDPHLNSLYYGAQILSNVHLGLLGTDARDRLTPGLASKWYYDSDQREWHFFLRKGARFSNGREVTGEDVKFSLERVADPKLSPPRAWVLSCVEGYEQYSRGETSGISGIKVIDPLHVAIKLVSLSGDFLLNLAQYSCAIVAREELAAGRIVGCGAYKIRERTKEKCVLEAFPHYCKGEPYIKEIEIRYGSENLDEKFLRGDYDLLVYESVDVPQKLAKSPQVKLLTQSMLGIGFVGFRLTSDNPLIKSKEARQAMAMAVDKHRLVAELFAGLAENAHSPVPPVLLDDSQLNKYPYDLARAKDLLRKAGFTSPRLRLLSRSDQAVPIFNKVEEFFAESMRQLGIQVEYEKVEHKVYLRPENLSKADAYVGRWVADSPSPDDMLTPLYDSSSPMNRVKYVNPTVDKLLSQARQILNVKKREDLYKQVQHIVMEDMPLIPLYYLLVGAAFRDDLFNVSLSPMGLLKCEDLLLE